MAAGRARPIRAVRAYRCRSEVGKNGILPWQGKWQGVALTEGCRAIDKVTPLHHFVVPLPLQGRIFGMPRIWERAAREPPLSVYFLANQVVSAGFRRVRVSMRVLIAAMARSTTLRDSGVRYWVA